jgi:hypothetical protein
MYPKRGALMAEQTKGGGFRERIYFDEELWHDIELTAAHMRLKPTELVKLLTALGLTQMKGLTMMGAMQQAITPVIQAEMEADFERMTGVPASTPIGQSGTPASSVSARKVVPARAGAATPAVPGRDETQQHMVRSPRQQLVRGPQQLLVRGPQQLLGSDDGSYMKGL